MRVGFVALAACTFAPVSDGNHAASDGASIDVVASNGYGSAVLADGPIAYWPLDDAGGPNIVDVMGFAPGTTSGQCVFGVPGGIATGKAIAFQNRTCQIDVGDHFGFQGTSPFSIEAWAQFDQSENMMFRHVFTHEARDQNGPVDGFALPFRDKSHVFAERCRDHANVVTPDAPVDGNFHYLVATFDGAQLALYVDGVLAQTKQTNASMRTYTAHAFIGAASSSENHFSGVIDEVAVYPHALGADRIAAHYAARTQ